VCARVRSQVFDAISSTLLVCYAEDPMRMSSIDLDMCARMHARALTRSRAFSFARVGTEGTRRSGYRREVLQGTTGYYWVLPRITGDDRVLPGSMRYIWATAYGHCILGLVYLNAQWACFISRHNGHVCFKAQWACLFQGTT
jgi:hypothetical protein